MYNDAFAKIVDEFVRAFSYVRSIEAVTWRCSVKKVFLEILQNSLENACARVSFLIKLQASGFWFNLRSVPKG